jgi:hypothetical protein
LGFDNFTPKKMGATKVMPYLRYRQAPAKGTQTEDAPKRARFRQHRSFGLKIGGFQIGRFCVNAKIYFSFLLIFRGFTP